MCHSTSTIQIRCNPNDRKKVTLQYHSVIRQIPYLIYVRVHTINTNITTGCGPTHPELYFCATFTLCVGHQSILLGSFE